MTDDIKPFDSAQDRLPLTSADLTEALLAQLRHAAPQIFSEGRVDFTKLQAALGEHIESGAERYGLNWAGKRDVFRNVQSPSIAALRPQFEESVNWDSTENLIIEGDNLEVLKLLQKPYHGKVKMNYIDPPCKSGNELVQLPETVQAGMGDLSPNSQKTDNPQYPTIAHITRERVRRVIAKLQDVGRDLSRHPEGARTSSRQGELVGLKPDLQNRLGFRAFKLDSSNFKIWQTDAAPRTAEQLAQQLNLYADNIQPERSEQDRLYELVLKSGFPLSAKIEAVSAGKQTAYSVADGTLLICLSGHLDQATLRALFAHKPQMVLCLDTAFDGNDALKTNTVLEAKTHGILFKTV